MDIKKLTDKYDRAIASANVADAVFFVVLHIELFFIIIALFIDNLII